jgi:two-component system, cell cycle sensor histidine kinase and response regulator CckA
MGNGDPKLSVAVVVCSDANRLHEFSEMARKSGLETLAFTRAEPALAVMDPNAPPALIITELGMPEIDGWRFCSLLRSREYAAFNKVPILLISAALAGDGAERIAADLGIEACYPSSMDMDASAFIERIRTIPDEKHKQIALRILIVESSKSQANLLKKAFTGNGYWADTALTIRDASEAFSKTAYNVAAIDCHMPDGMGESLLDQFHAAQPGCICIMMTADPKPELSLDWMKRGASACLHKPFEPECLLELCVRIRQRRTLLRAEELFEARTRELGESEERYKQIKEAVSDYIYTVQIENGAAVSTKHGPGCYAITGYHEKEFDRNPFLWLDMVPSTDRDRVIEQAQRAAAGEEVAAIEHQIVRKDGEMRWVSNTPVLHRDERGVVFRYDGLIHDITERKRAEKQVQQSHHRYQQLVDHASDGVFALNAAGAFAFLNEGICRILGYTREELLHLNILDTYPDEFRDEGRQRLARIRQEDTTQFERPMKRKDGSLITIEASCWKSEEGYTHAIVRDITERKRAEETREKLQEQLRQAQRMEAVGQLAGGVAHDFNNILAAIMLNVGLAETLPNLDPQIKQMIKEIQADASRAANLTRQLLLFSRRSVMNMKLLNVNDVVAGMLKMLERLIGENIRLRFDHKDGLPTVKADAGMIEQVLMNLAVNARDAMPKGGSIMISTDAVDVAKEQIESKPEVQPGRFICLSVSDTGCGMDENTRERIFEPFFTTKEQGKGTGLGLATVYGIVAQHHGWVEVASEVGKGATFKVFLPADQASAADKTQSEEDPAIRGHETILLVEDDRSLRLAMIQGLRSLGYRVIDAANGYEAIQKWKEHQQQIDLLFSDMVMPEGLTGLDLAETFWDSNPDLKVIISSGYSTETVGEAKLSTGNIAYLQKPYKIEVMAKTIRNFFGQK